MCIYWGRILQNPFFRCFVESANSHASRLLLYMTPDRALDGQNWPDMMQQNVREFHSKAKESGWDSCFIPPLNDFKSVSLSTVKGLTGTMVRTTECF